jgi:hypothetical protein
MADLRIEEFGQYAGAVRVYVQGVMVGSIAHERAEPFREVIRELNALERPATCRANLEVGEYVDVWLSAKPQSRAATEPFLPDYQAGAPVVLSVDGAARLDQMLGPRARNKRIKPIASLTRVQSGGWDVCVGAEAIGSLSGSYDDRRLVEAERAGFPLTTRLLVVRQEGRALRAQAGLP